uniref:GmrSD restriction endonucleases N-terminal domain-containing protein n=1 Tax=Tolypothrix bouteillei VB521301 TaxID=1479485 RepID=A0A0C1REK1_9CYAN
MNISTILDQIDMGAIALPEFQRGYVWNRDQVKALMNALYRKHPVGTLLVWETKTDQAEAHARGDGKLSAGSVKLLLDGQARRTASTWSRTRWR